MKTKTILNTLIGLLILNAIVFQACKKEADEPNQGPSCDITAPSDGENFGKGQVVTITVAASDSDGDITEVIFIIDGTNKSTLNSVPYKYDWNTNGESIGNHTIKAKSVDNDGASASDEITIEIIEDNKPAAAFAATPTNGGAPLTVNFTDQSTNDPTSWLWDFGDGNNSTEQNPSYVYNDMGTYDVSMTVTNDDGSDTETKTSFIIVTDVFTDSRDGQTYNIVIIGSQTWFAENLNYETTDSWWYDDDEANGDLFGRLYTWNAAMIACPGGWRLPSDNEWKQLEMFLGMSQSQADGTEVRGTDEGKKLKSTSGWPESYVGTDEVGFKAVSSGIRHYDGYFQYPVSYTSYWSSTEKQDQNWRAWRRVLLDSDQIGRVDYRKDYGFSVRCIKND